MVYLTHTLLTNPANILHISGVYRRSKELKSFIDITSVPELRSHSIIDDELVVGANVTLAEFEQLLKTVSKQMDLNTAKTWLTI